MNYRFKALELATNRSNGIITYGNDVIFAHNVFNHNILHLYYLKRHNTETKKIGFNRQPSLLMHKETFFGKYKNNIIDEEVAKTLALLILDWCDSKNVNHYTHWFSPMNGRTAEKHDSFINKQGIPEFSYKELMQQEPDASSFPNGGIRSTFEARGYTAWDSSSPPFIIDNTLCIPSIFISYSEESLDYKLPLLKTIKTLGDISKDLLDNYLGYKPEVKDTQEGPFGVSSECDTTDARFDGVSATSKYKVFPNLGWEQEYFLIDTALYNARPDLLLAGRTLFGHSSPKDQQLSDHYFGVIPERRLNFMKELEREAHLIGIPLKTRHNEVAPNQFEFASIYEEMNLSIDHNQVIMFLIEKIAKKHDLTAILHDKPFAGINGSGKHCNWSLSTSLGYNLLDPNNNKCIFVVFLVNILRALAEHNDLLRASIASTSNDLRLGGHEAPPAIISAFIGKDLTKLLSDIGNSKNSNIEKLNDINFSDIFKISKDNTDRNRTSPFAFTGDKFEFRAVGSSANCSPSMIVLNLIVANQLKEFKMGVDTLISNGYNKSDAINTMVKNYIRDSKKICFEGDNYSDEWLTLAHKLGLKNIKSTPEALECFDDEKSINLFESNNILSRHELIARKNIRLEEYVFKIQIEGRVIGDLANNHIIPVAIKYLNILLETMGKIPKIDNTHDNIFIVISNMIKNVSKCIELIKTNVDSMTEERKKANIIENISEKAFAYKDKVLPYFNKIRYNADKLELMVDDELWTLPKYRELLFF